MIGPLSLALETAADRIVSDSFLPTSLRQIRVALIQILDDDCHLSGELPVFFLLLIRLLNEIRVLIEALLCIFLDPCKSLLVLILIVDVLFHTTKDLYLVNGLHTHTKVLLKELLVDDGSTDTHTLGTDL